MNSSLAIIFTCHNRKEKTCECIKSIQDQINIPAYDLYVCDDGSTDGTDEGIKRICPNAIILRGNGNMCWSRGMYVAMKAAVKKGYKFYLMINDDVYFFHTMWESMYQAYLDNPRSGVVGCTLSKTTGKQTYGGANFIIDRKGDYIGPMLAPDKNKYISCDLANWNCVLLDSDIVKEVGIIDNRYEHAMGDFDYSFRMKEKDYGLILAKDFIGYCENNEIKNTFKDHKVPRKNRIEKLFAPNGLPTKSWKYFVYSYYQHGKHRNYYAPYIKYLLCIALGRDC